MPSYHTTLSLWSRLCRAAQRVPAPTVALAALVLVACNPTEVLKVTDPDIINVSDVASTAGADAARVGALARLNVATSGGESLLQLGGLFTDEWNNGDSYIARQEIDQRVITPQNTFLDAANRSLHRARVGAALAIGLLRQYSPAAPGCTGATGRSPA